MPFFQDTQQKKLKSFLSGSSNNGNNSDKFMMKKTPTTRDVLGRIYTAMQTDQKKGQAMQSIFSTVQSDPSSAYYNPYTKATNRAISNMSALGVDMSNVNDDWLNANAYLKQYYQFGTTNTPTKPGKNASGYEQAAYEYYQIAKAEEKTKAAERESAAMQEELTYWAQRKDRNYSDDEILKKINWSKYPTLSEMRENAAMGTPTILNRAVDGWNDDWAYGVMWAARNNGGTGNSYQDQAMSALGAGNVWKPDPVVTAKLDATSDTYSPYSVGSTLEEEGLYFGMDNFPKNWVEKNAVRIGNSNDETEKRMFQNVAEAEDRTRGLEVSLANMDAAVDRMVQSGYSDDAIISELKGNQKYSNLFELDKTISKNGVGLVGTTRPIDYSWNSMEAKIKELVAKKEAEPTASENTQDMMSSLMGANKTAGTSPASSAANPSLPVSAGLDLRQEEELDLEKENFPNNSSLIEEEEIDLENENIPIGKQPKPAGAPLLDVTKGRRPGATIPTKASGIKLQEEEEIDFELDDPTRIAEEKNAQRNLTTAAKAVDDFGTEEEKMVFQSGRSIHFDGCARDISTLLQDNKYSQNAKQMLQNDMDNKTTGSVYMGLIRTKDAYETAQSDLEEANAELDKTNRRINVLEQIRDNFGGMTTSDRQLVNDLLNNNDTDELRKLLSSSDDSDQFSGLNYIYRKAYESQAIGAEDGATSTDLSPSSVKKNEDGTWEGIPQKVLDLAEYVMNGTPGQDNTFSGFTAEMEDELNDLYEDRDEWEEDISDLEIYLDDNKTSYDRAVARRDNIFNLLGGSDLLESGLDTNTIESIELAQWAGKEWTGTIRLPGLVYDLQLGIDGKDRPALNVEAQKNLEEGLDAASKLKYILDNEKNLGLDLTDEERRNIQQKLSVIQTENSSAADFLLDSADDFQTLSRETMEKGVTDDMSHLTKMNVRALLDRKVPWDLTNEGDEGVGYAIKKAGSMLVHGDEEFRRQFFELAPSLLGEVIMPGSSSVQEHTEQNFLMDEYLKTVTHQETLRYFYLLATEGEDAANEYFKRLMNENNGYVTVRTHENISDWVQEQASQGEIGTMAWYVVSFATKLMGDVDGTKAYVEDRILGREPNPTGFRYGMMNVTKDIRAGVQEAIHNQGWEGDIVDVPFESLTSAGDSAIMMLATHGIGKGIGAGLSKLGSAAPWIQKILDVGQKISNAGHGVGSAAGFVKEVVHAMPMATGAAVQAYLDVVDRGGSPDQAKGIFWNTFLAESLSEGIRFASMAGAYKSASVGDIKGFFANMFTDGIDEMFGEGLNQWWEDRADTLIMGELSHYNELVNYYWKEQGLPRSVAERMADQDMSKNIFRAAISGFLSAGMSNTAAYTAGRATNQTVKPNNNRTLQDVALLNHQVNSTDATSGAIAISGVVGTAVPGEVANATGQNLISRMSDGSVELATTTVRGLLLATEENNTANLKDAISYAVLTEGKGKRTGRQGEATRTMQDIIQKAKAGETITRQDSENLIQAVHNDRTGVNAEFLNDRMANNLETNRRATIFMELLAQGRYDEALKATGKDVEKAQNKAINAQRDSDDAFANRYAVSQTAQAAAEANLQNPSNDAVAAFQHASNQLVAADSAAQNLADAAINAENDLQRVKKEANSKNEKTMNEVRQEVEQVYQQEQEQKAQEEEQKRIDAEKAAEQEKADAIAKEQRDVDDTVFNGKVEDFIEKNYPNATAEQRQLLEQAAERQRARIEQERQAMGKIATSDEMLNRKAIAKMLTKKFGFNIDIQNLTETREDGKQFRPFAKYVKDTNTIVLDNTTSINDMMYFALGHDITHIAEKSGTYKELANALLKSAYGEDVDYDSVLANLEKNNGMPTSELEADIMYKKTEQYDKQTGKESNYETIMQEVVADRMGDLLNSSDEETRQNLVNRLAEEKPNVLRRIIDSIKSFLKKATGMKGEWRTNAEKTVDMLEIALRDAQEKQNIGNVSQQNSDTNTIATDDQGNALATEFPDGTAFVAPSSTETVDSDTGEVKYSLSSFTEEEQERVRQALLDSGNYTEEQVDKYLDNAMGLASMIAADKTRLDFKASDNQVFLKPNSDYYFTLDASTLCAKRLLYQGTFDYVQHALPDEVFTPEDLIDLVNIMNDMGYETPCGICYVESRRRWLDTYAQRFLDNLPSDADTFIEKYFKKSSDEEKTLIRERFTEEKPSIDDLTTSDGLEALRSNNPDMYAAFVKDMNAKGTANPKVVQLRTEYRGDIVKKMTKNDIQKVIDIGGLRIQSFSDFETPHLLDMVQAVLDMSSVGLTAQAYTKVSNFAWVFGDTGIKINLSLIGKGTGLDENGNLVFDNREGINFDEAMKLRDRYGKNVGTILVGINDEHIIAAMGDPRIDFIIPFHKSGWSAEELRKMPTLNNYNDYTATQNELLIIGKNEDGSYKTESFKKHKERTKESLENLQPVGKNGYWNFDESGQWNAENYLKLCAKKHRIPKFSQFLVDNGDGTFSLPQGTDKRSTSIREGYWKTLIDFKMYENDSYGRTRDDGTKTDVKGAKQEKVTPNINMDEARRILDDYKLGRQMPDQADGTKGKFIPMESNNSVPVATPAGDEFIELIKRKRGWTKTPSPNPDSLEADLPEAVNNPRATIFGASQAPAVLGNTESIQEESPAAKQKAMYADSEDTGVKWSLPSQPYLDQQLYDYLNSDEDLSEAPNLPSNQTEELPKAYRQFGRQTAQTSDALHQEVKDYLYNNSTYTPDTNGAQVDRAISWVQSHANEQDQDGYFGSLAEIESKGFDYRSADGQARMLTMMSMAALKGDIAAEKRLADVYNRQGTDIGQMLQARKIFRLMTPLGRQATLQGMVDEINEQYGRQGNNRRVELSDWIMEAASVAHTEEEFDRVRQAAAEELADQMPANWKEKLTGWRMLSMLSAPGTHVRNVAGNLLFMPSVAIKNKIGALMELGLKQENRTKTLGLASQEARAFAKEDVQKVRDLLTGDAKYKEGNQVQQERKIWGQGDSFISKTFGKATQWSSDMISKALEAEDWAFLRRHYRNSLAGFMTARGLTEADMTGDTLDEARAYAIQEAKKATYRDANFVADWLNKSPKAIKFFADALLPFKKTPMNILRRGIEYSPAGIIKNLTLDAKHLKQYMNYKNGKLDALPKTAISPSEYIDKISASLTGLGTSVLGYLFASLGAVKVRLDDKDDKFDKIRGSQEYSIELFGTDISETIDWAAPACMAFFVGASLYNDEEDTTNMSDKDFWKWSSEKLDALMHVTEPIFNLSMLDGINGVLNTGYNSASDKITQVIANVSGNYISSYVPSVAGTAARIIDPTRRKVFIQSGSNTPERLASGTWERIQNRIPFLSRANIPYRNEWGFEDTDTTIGAIIENFVNPGYSNKINRDDPVTNEMERLYNAVESDNKNAVIPKSPNKSFSMNKEDINLTDKQYEQMEIDRNQKAYYMIGELIENPEYQNADDETKAMIVKNIWTYADQTAKNTLTGGQYEMDKWVSAVAEGDDPVESAIDKAVDDNREAQAKGYGQSLTNCLKDNDIEGAQTSIAGMRRSGRSDSTIRSNVTKHYKPIYQKAYKEGDVETMLEIELMLENLDETIKWTEKDFNSWLKDIKTDEE